MQQVQRCPICEKEQIPMDEQQCPQCNADLTCFQVLDALPEHQETAVRAVSPQGSRRIWWLGLTAVVILLMGLGWMFYQNFRIVRTLADNQSRLEYVNQTMLALMKKIESEKAKAPAKEPGKEAAQEAMTLGAPSHEDIGRESPDTGKSPEHKAQPEPKAQEAKPVPVPKAVRPVASMPDRTAGRHPAPRKDRASRPKEAPFFWYEATDQDTLWSIADRFYGRGRYYPVLLAMNPQVSVFEIKGGQRLKVLENPKDAAIVFSRSVERHGSLAFLWYQVQAGDTPETLSRKFFRTDDQYSRIESLNSQLRLEPGQKIKIPLPDL
ncbi:MAG: LysM peptidoglycan-binding domain-containing protein [bacterium]